VNLFRRQFLRMATGIAALGPRSHRAWAQAYPARPVRVIVPFGPGGSADVVGRIISQALSERIGRQFYVENVSGAGGNIGMGRAAQAAPDGYTLLFAVPSYVINPALYDEVPYDARKSFDPVTLAVSTTVVLAMHPAVPAQTLGDLIALMKASPGKYNYATAGVGSPGHLVGEMLRRSQGLDLAHIPYTGAGLAIEATVAGHTTICIAAPAPIVPQVESGKLRALAVTYRTRLHALPNVPTTAEAGYPDIEFDNWFGVFAPAGTPSGIITHLQQEIATGMAAPDVKQRLVALGFDPVGSTPTEFSRQIRIELTKWADVIRAANIRVE
jgi:tripartite-type tricarboxylate transporter receptor subunit TctC